jgi:2-hydroxychromene-2-carboxylate isomerase
MPRDVAFLYDYASSYSYLASERIASELAGVTVAYRPIYLRGFEAFTKGPPFSAAKLAYMAKDLQRCAAELGLPVAMPASFPVNGVYALRGAIAAQRAGVFERYHAPMFRAIWAERREGSTRDGVAAIMRELGLPELVDGLDDPSIKDELRQATADAAARGAFGAPTFVVGAELFWGHDRMHQVARAARA